MKNIKLNKIKLALGLLGVIGATSLVAPILVSCGGNTPTESGNGVITAKANNDLTIWEMNAIANGHKDIKLLSRAFDGVKKFAFDSIEVNHIKMTITLIVGESSITSKPSSEDSCVITESLVNEYMKKGNIWYNKKKFTEADLKCTTVIGEQSFSEWKLNSFIIPDTVTKIDNFALRKNQLTSIIIPDSVTSIGIGAFEVNNLSSVTIGNNVKEINNQAFYNNKLTSVIIPNSVTSIDNGAFRLNKLSSVTFGEKIENIGVSAFQDNQLTSLNIPNSITTISNSAFTNNKLTELRIPNNITNIGNSSFQSNLLTSIIIPDSVTSIGKNAFKINKLKSITIQGENIKNIAKGAFSEQDRLLPNDIRISMNDKIWDLVCDWKLPDGTSLSGDGKSVRENIGYIFGWRNRNKILFS